MAEEDLVSDPQHYKATGGLEPINIIEAFDLPFHLACAVRYICRFEGKGGALDLMKALWYIARFLHMYYKLPPEEILNINLRKPFDDMAAPPPTALRG